jgi:hypothetical protein
MADATTSFYDSIPAFSNFADFTVDSHFRRVPSDWWVLLTDVRGSTAAIEAGRYKDVNRVGAAAIACAQKALGGKDFPYVFGGDGATLLAPPEGMEAVSLALAVLQAHAEKRFKLKLRVGRVAVSEVEAAGTPIEVARFELAGGRCTAVFRGGGLATAEKKIKGDPAQYSVPPAKGVPDLDELSCRWNAVPAKRGRSVSLLVVARSGDTVATYRDVMAGLDRILEQGLEASNPIQRSSMSYRSWWSIVRDEARQFPTAWSRAFAKKLLGVTVSVLTLQWGVKPGFYDPVAYANSIPAHSDYRKFDDTLRLVVDCAPAQVENLRAFLEGLRQQGLIHYGLHESNNTLVTCYVQGTDPGQHIHFVDGGDGGYAMAAKQLKAQIKGQDEVAA